MRRVFKGIGACTTLVLAVFIVSCGESPTAVPEVSQTPLTDFTTLAGENCLNDLPGSPDSRFNNATCTANDIEIKVLQVVSVDGNPQDPNQPLLCAEGETLNVGLVAFFGINATERYDVGYYFAVDGGDAKTGQCFHGFLPGLENGGAADPTGITGGPDPTIFDGYYRNLEPEDGGDVCGDVPESDEILLFGEQVAAARTVPATVPVTCEDPDGDGFIEVATCTSWDNNDKETCEGVEDAVPGTPSKCNCEPALLPIVFLPKLTVNKVLIPDTDDGLFNLKIDDDIHAANVGDGGTTGAIPLDPGTYTVSETAGTDTDLANYDRVISGDCATDGSVTLAVGDDKVCTITNTRKPKIIIKKTVIGNGATFDFTGEITATLGDGQTAEKLVSPGQYTVTETPVTAYSLTDITCDDGDSSGNTGTGVATFNVEAGEVVQCVFTNTKQGVITVKKITDPAGDPQQFTFAGDVAGTIGHDGTASTENLDPGQYTSTETVPAGWDLTDITCSDANSTGNTGTGVATFNLEAGESITCTFTNTKRGSITLEKQTLPDGDTEQFTYAGDLAGTIGDGGTLTTDVGPGQYTSTETIPAGWALTSIVCDDGNSSGNTGTGVATFNVEAGEDVKCVFTNTKDGKITVEKQTLPDGDPQQFTYAGDVAGTIGDGGTISADVAPGQYTSTETIPAMWALTDITCDDGNSSGNTGTGVATFNVEAGEEVKCVFTNTKGGMIKVVKQTIPDGAAGSFTFAGDVAGSIGDGGMLSASVAPGQHTSTETVPAGWELTDITCDDGDSSGNTGTGVATFNVDPGETVTCTFTNTKRGSITLEKQTIPDGDTQQFTYAGDLAGTIGDGGTLTTDVGPGQYTSTETIPAGWALTSIVCDDGNSSGNTGTGVATFNVEAGEDVKCVFTNTKDGKITVEKQTLPDGDPQQFTYAGDVAGTIGDGGTISADVAPGQYTSTETIPAMWALTDITCDDGNSSGNTGTGVATFNVEAGEEVKCVFTNTKGGKIIVEKQTIPDGATQLFAFTGDVSGSIADGGTLMSDVAPGQYSSTETIPALWELTDITCNDGNSTGNPATATATFNVEPGETVTCVFTNDEIEVCEPGDRLTSVSLQVNAVTGPDTPPLLIEWTDDNGNLDRATFTAVVPSPSSVTDVFTITPQSGTFFDSQNLRFRLGGETSKNLKVHLSCSDDPAIGDIHFGDTDSFSATLEKTAFETEQF